MSLQSTFKNALRVGQLMIFFGGSIFGTLCFAAGHPSECPQMLNSEQVESGAGIHEGEDDKNGTVLIEAPALDEMTVARSSEGLPDYNTLLEEAKENALWSDDLMGELSFEWRVVLNYLPESYHAEYFVQASNLRKSSVRASFIYDIAQNLRQTIWMRKKKYEEAKLLAKLGDFITRYERWEIEPKETRKEFSVRILFEQELFESMSSYDPLEGMDAIRNVFELLVRSQVRAWRRDKNPEGSIKTTTKAHSITVHALRSYLDGLIVFLRNQIQKSPNGVLFLVPLKNGIGQAADLRNAKVVSPDTGAKVELFWELKEILRHLRDRTRSYERYPIESGLEEAKRWNAVVRLWSQASDLLSGAQASGVPLIDWQIFTAREGYLKLETDESLPIPFLQRKRSNSPPIWISP